MHQVCYSHYGHHWLLPSNEKMFIEKLPAMGWVWMIIGWAEDEGVKGKHSSCMTPNNCESK